jgi:metal-responsive CopG/Arc/MetJ family transcriptional regulator
MKPEVRRETRIVILLSERELREIDSFRFDSRMPNRSATVRELIRLGLTALKRNKPE